MVTEYIEAKKIKSIRVEPSKLSAAWEYREYKPAEKGFLGIIKSKEIKSGYYNIYNNSYYATAEDVVFIYDSGSTRLFVKANQTNENKIWEKARVVIKFKGDYSTAYFENDQDAIDFADEISKKFDHIKIKY